MRHTWYRWIRLSLTYCLPPNQFLTGAHPLQWLFALAIMFFPLFDLKSSVIIRRVPTSSASWMFHHLLELTKSCLAVHGGHCLPSSLLKELFFLIAISGWPIFPPLLNLSSCWNLMPSTVVPLDSPYSVIIFWSWALIHWWLPPSPQSLYLPFVETSMHILMLYTHWCSTHLATWPLSSWPPWLQPPFSTSFEHPSLDPVVLISLQNHDLNPPTPCSSVPILLLQMLTSKFRVLQIYGPHHLFTTRHPPGALWWLLSAAQTSWFPPVNNQSTLIFSYSVGLPVETPASPLRLSTCLNSLFPLFQKCADCTQITFVTTCPRWASVRHLITRFE